jgi:photosystem II oxygen-evolving enhancer protein 2
MTRLKQIAAVLLIVLSLSLQSCVSATAALRSYVDSYDGYQFLYPTGWVQVAVENGPDVVFHDLIQETENVSVIISPVPDGKTLQELGTPSEVGYKLSKNAIAPPDSGRTAELVSAESRQDGDITYYLLDYAVQLPTQQRHNFASVVVRRGQLYTINLSATEERWEKLKDTFKSVINSFSVY